MFKPLILLGSSQFKITDVDKEAINEAAYARKDMKLDDNANHTFAEDSTLWYNIAIFINIVKQTLFAHLFNIVVFCHYLLRLPVYCLGRRTKFDWHIIPPYAC